MCLAIPGQITSLKGRLATIKYPNAAQKALVGEKNCRVGDYVMVQMGVIIKKLSGEEIKALRTLPS